MIRLAITSCILFSSGALLVSVAAAAACPADAQQVSENNSLILLGGTARGAVKQVVMGEFGKDVNQQRRLLGSFDRCGSLLRAELSDDRQENGVTLSMVQSIMRVKTGWEAVYEVSVLAEREGRQVEVDHKQGTIRYLRGKDGSIVSSSDRFLWQGKPGFSATTNTFDRQRRLLTSVSRGSDASGNGVVRYRWNRKNQLQSMEKDDGRIRFSYDAQGREARLSSFSSGDISTTSGSDECQLWDDKDNCTLSYSAETEVFAQHKIQRHTSAAYRFEYWDEPQKRGLAAP